MIALKGHTGDVQASTAHKGVLITGGHDKSLSVWNCQGKLVRRLKNTHEHIVRVLTVYSGALYPQPVIISGSWDGNIKLWNLDGGKKAIGSLTGHESRVKALAAISDHEKDAPAILVSGGDDCYIKVWDLGTNECIRTIESHTHFIMDLAICQRRKEDGCGQEYLIVSSSSDKTVLVHHIDDTEKHCRLGGHGQGDVTSLLHIGGSHRNGIGDKDEGRYHRDSILCSGNAEGSILVYSVESIFGALSSAGSEVDSLFSLKGHKAKVTGLCVSNSSEVPLLFSVSSDGYLRSWLLSTREAGAINTDINDLTSSIGGNKKGAKVSLLSCASTPTYKPSSLSTDSEDAGGGGEIVEIYSGVLLKASEELILTGTDGFVLLLSIATLANSTDDHNTDSWEEMGGKSGEIVEEGKSGVQEAAIAGAVETSGNGNLNSGEMNAVESMTTSSSDVLASSIVSGTPENTEEQHNGGASSPNQSSPSSLLAMISDPNLSFGLEGLKEANKGKDALSGGAEDSTTTAPSSNMLNSSSVSPFGMSKGATPTAQGNGRRAARALSSTSQAREREAQRSVRNARGGGGKRQILQPSSNDEPPSNILLASGPRVR